MDFLSQRINTFGFAPVGWIALNSWVPHIPDVMVWISYFAVAVMFFYFFRHQRAAEALRKSEMRLRSVTQSANEAIISADQEGNIIFWNSGAQAIFGYAEEEVLGKPLTILMPE